MAGSNTELYLQQILVTLRQLTVTIQAIAAGGGGSGGGGTSANTISDGIGLNPLIQSMQLSLVEVSDNTNPLRDLLIQIHDDALSQITATTAVKDGVEAATNLANLETLLSSINVSVGATTTNQLTEAQVKSAIESASNLDGLETFLSAIQSGQLTEAQLKNAIETATNLNDLETLLTQIRARQLTGGGSTNWGPVEFHQIGSALLSQPSLQKARIAAPAGSFVQVLLLGSITSQALPGITQRWALICLIVHLGR